MPANNLWWELLPDTPIVSFGSHATASPGTSIAATSTYNSSGIATFWISVGKTGKIYGPVSYTNTSGYGYVGSQVNFEAETPEIGPGTFSQLLNFDYVNMYGYMNSGSVDNGQNVSDGTNYAEWMEPNYPDTLLAQSDFPASNGVFYVEYDHCKQ